MARKRRTKAWWQAAVARWRQSGRTAAEFASREGLSLQTLRWWSSQLGRGTRAEHGSPALMPIEIAVPAGGVRTRKSSIEVELRSAVLRFEEGTDVVYVAALLHALQGHRGC